MHFSLDCYGSTDTFKSMKGLSAGFGLLASTRVRSNCVERDRLYNSNKNIRLKPTLSIRSHEFFKVYVTLRFVM